MYFSLKPLRLEKMFISIGGKKFLESHTLQGRLDAEICCNKRWTYWRVLVACCVVTVTLNTVMEQNYHSTVEILSNRATIGGTHDKESAKLLTSRKFPALLCTIKRHRDQIPPLSETSSKLDKTEGKWVMSLYLLSCKRAEVMCFLNTPNGTSDIFRYCSTSCGLQLQLNIVSEIQSTAIWDAVGFSWHLHVAGKNNSGLGTADHEPSGDVDGRQVRYLGHLKWQYMLMSGQQ